MTLLPELERQVRRSAHRAWPRPHRRRRWGRVVVPLTALALAGALFAVLVPSDGGERSVPPADERAVTVPPPSVAFFEPDPDKIVYVRSRSVDHEGSTIMTEEWHRGREDHRVERWRNVSEGNRLWEADRLVDADGAIRQIDEEGDYREIRATHSEDAANVIAERQAGFLANFRARAEQGTLDPDAEFAGRPANRFHIAGDSTEPTRPSPELSYYFDRETGKPLGMTSELRMNEQRVMSVTQTVEAIEELDPTPENLAKLREFVLERK